ncbi:MAG: cell division protein FtsA [alpha proteobacterium HIMB114]|nr:MAG: cell division protein FtsA [alpha proteobacterium HIMB114]
MINEKITILDLGSHKIKLLVISLNEKNYIDIHAKFSIYSSGIKKGNIVDIEKFSSKIKSCIETVEKELKFKIKNIFVGINSLNFNFLTFGLSRNIGSYEIEKKKDLQNLISSATSIFYQNLPNHKIIHFLNSGFYLDKYNYVENPIGLRSKTLDVNFSFLSLDKNIISNFDKAIAKLGLSVTRYFYSPFANSILSADQDSLERGFVNINFGFDKTSITLFENSKILFSSIIPIGSSHINNDLMKAVGIDKNLAEKIKLNFDEILSGKINNLLETEIKKTKISLDIIIKIVNARIEEIIEHIFNKIIYCKSLNKSARQIIINGGGSELPIFKRKLSKKLNTSVEYAKQSFPIKDTEFNIFHDYMVCLGIAKLIFFPNKDEIKSFVKKKSGFFSKFYSLFLKS